VAGAQDDGVPARERLRGGEVGDLVPDQALSRGGTLARRAARPRRPVRLPPGARRVDDRPRVQLALVPVLAGDVHGERLVTPPGVDEAVAPWRTPRSPGSVPDPVAERVRERAQVPGDPLGAVG